MVINLLKLSMACMRIELCYNDAALDQRANKLLTYFKKLAFINVKNTNFRNFYLNDWDTELQITKIND